MSDTTERAYTVKGMTCEHCVAAVDAEIGRIPGVQSVAIELGSGRVLVSSAGRIADEAVRAAVEEAGYSLAGPA